MQCLAESIWANKRIFNSRLVIKRSLTETVLEATFLCSLTVQHKTRMLVEMTRG